MTRDELKAYNGRDGAPAYVAYKNIVYDVSKSPLWKEGEHQGMHNAGVDLTEALEGAPHSDEVFKKFPVITTLVQSKKQTSTPPHTQRSFKATLGILYKKYHPHPMLVHFPIALHLFAAGLDLLFLAIPKEAYAVGVFYSFFTATVMGFFAMIPGIFSWWINYNFSRHYALIIKFFVATLTIFLGIIAIIIHLENPNVAYEHSLLGITYHFIIFFTAFCVIVLGYYGGKISWGNILEAQEEEQQPTLVQPLQEESSVQRAARQEHITTLLKPPTTTKNKATQKTLSILIGGAAGLGIDTLEKILSDALRKSGYYLFTTKEFMSRVRGGSNTVLLRIASAPIFAPCWEVDIAVALDAAAFEHMQERYRHDTRIFADESLKAQYPEIIAVAMQQNAAKLGDPRYANTYMAGLLFGVLQLDKTPLLQSITEHFKEQGANKEAVTLGYTLGAKDLSVKLPPVPKADRQAVQNLHLMDGTTACGFGFLTGGCNMITAYPMSPSTGVLNFMAAMSKEFDIAVEQSEDEIASLMMTLGGWYGGARAMTSTSGGGFALMGEALSLSGMTETPAVIYLAQRPGPATGLPTRSEQGDLNMALYSGHGPFPRVVLAPGSLEECIYYGYLAFELADKYQTPVIVLSDQYLADSIFMINEVDLSTYARQTYSIKSDTHYMRYQETKNGISPRAIPGFGDGLLCAVGDEHDQRGQITESFHVREQMVAKRAQKSKELLKEAIAPTCKGDGDIAIISWGSSKGAITEALERLGDERLAQVHFAWVHPLSSEQLSVLDRYKYKIVIENNADGAFTDQLKLHDIKVDEKILQSNGFSFFADQLASMINKVVKELV